MKLSTFQGIIFSLILMSFSCNVPEANNATEIINEPTTPENVNTKILEAFTDSSRIGRNGKNKIHIDILEGSDPDSPYKPHNIARIEFFSLSRSNELTLKQTLEIETQSLMEAQPEIKDFNNDGLNDITFVSNTAARGANEVRTLLIYEKNTDSLIHVKNSEDYPNLAYNKTMNCIDSWMVHGASTTVFLRLVGDELKLFASVGTGGDTTGECCGLEVRVVDANGKEKVIKRKKITEGEIYTRYRTFNPPRP